MHPSSPAREDVAFSNLDIQKVIKLLFSENFCLEEKCSLLCWLRFITQMAEQMSRGHPQLASKCIKRGAVGRGGHRKEAGGEQTQAGDSPVLPGAALFGPACLWYPGHPHILTQLSSPSPASLLPRTLFRAPGLSVAERAICYRHMVSPLWKLLIGGTLELSLFVPKTAYFCGLFFPPKLNHSCP